MSTTTLAVEGMSCQHCVKAVTEALQGVDGVRAARVDLERGAATVEHDGPVPLQSLISAVEDEGYTARAEPGRP